MVRAAPEDAEECKFFSMVFYCVKYAEQGKLGAAYLLKFIVENRGTVHTLVMNFVSVVLRVCGSILSNPKLPLCPDLNLSRICLFC